jgi:NDP-sugar pyrophosphorylase family protein
MLAGAILVVGQGPQRHWAGVSWEYPTEPGVLGENPIVCLELLGQSVLDRTIQKLLRDGVKLVTVVIREEFSHLARTSEIQGARIHSVPPEIDLWSAAECTLREYVDEGLDLVLLTRLNAYAELDLGDLVRFHRATKQGVTAVTKDSEPLDSWVIEADEVREMRRIGLPVLVNREGLSGATSYSVPGYVSRL